MPNRLSCLFLIFLCLFLTACDSDAPKVSFYFWKTGFILGDKERKAIVQNDLTRLYVRYFDVGMNNGKPVPLGVIRADSFPKAISIIPVIYIKNEVFKKPHDSLATNIWQLVSAISKRTAIAPQEIQFDCDWTETTQNGYFSFLKNFKAITNKTLSATIRLHQVKYKTRTGIPPVDRGVLMYYNMGKIGSEANSIYDPKTAARYTPYLKSYPLPMDIALPIFGWSIQMRHNKPEALLNKTDEKYFRNDTNFTYIRDGRYQVKHSLFKAGFYLRQGDAIKTERIEENALRSMIKDLSLSMKAPPREILFFDLDAINLTHYNETIFKELAAGFY